MMTGTGISHQAVPLPRPADVAAAGAVHDLGNLIQIAASAVNIVARAHDMPPERSGPLLARATASLDQAGALVRHTIGAFRDRAAVAVDTSIADCIALVAALLDMRGERGLALEIDLDPDLRMVHCDPLGLQNAILNLVFNARDAMAGNGVVRVHAQFVGLHTEIRVSDSGIGMSLATIARAFDPFFTTKSDGLGGVGLPMVEHFVRDAGGAVSIESEPGVGTTVTMRLPATTPALIPTEQTR
jgi:signal transduction histidine kinase